MSTVYVTWVYRTFYSHYTVHIPKELVRKCAEIVDNCRSLRRNRPNVFCGFITSLLFLLAVVGNIVNGTYILLGKSQVGDGVKGRMTNFSMSAGSLIVLAFLTSKYEIKVVKENNGKCRRFTS